MTTQRERPIQSTEKTRRRSVKGRRRVASGLKRLVPPLLSAYQLMVGVLIDVGVLILVAVNRAVLALPLFRAFAAMNVPSDMQHFLSLR